MGNIIVPHSGNVQPDGHSNHRGAWPADVYYGDMDGVWTDETVNNTASIQYPHVFNVPGDGNFDQDVIPGELELSVYQSLGLYVQEPEAGSIIHLN